RARDPRRRAHPRADPAAARGMGTRMIRPAEPPDLPAVLALLAEAKLPTAGVAEHFGSFFVVDEGGRIVASARLERHGDAALLRSLAVVPDMRSTGLGAAVLRRALHEADGHAGGLYALT